MSRSASSTWRRIGAVVLIAGAAVFLGATIARNAAQLRAFDWSVSWGLLLLSIAALVAVFAWGVVVWKLVLDRFEHPPIGVGVLLRIWFASNLARYIPGKIWQFVGAAELARTAGLSRVVVLTSMVVHVGFTLLAAAIVSAVSLATWEALPLPGIPLWIFAAASVLLVHPAVINAGLRLVPEKLHDGVLRWNGSWMAGMSLLTLSVLSWTAYGLAFALFLHAVIGIDPADILPLTGVNALAFLTGYAAFFAPAGLGAREGAMAVLLRPFAPAGVAAVVAVVSRLWTIAAELIGAGIVLAATRRMAKGDRNWSGTAAPGEESEKPEAPTD